MNIYNFFLIINIFYFIYSITPYNKRKFIWQLHSYNDINEIGQELRKGAIHFKIDLFYVPKEECLVHDKRANKDPRGCFLLTHDYPVYGKYYYTMFQYFDRILYYYKNYQEKETKYIALCFKNTPYDICDDDYYNWVSLTTDYYNYLENIIIENKLNLVLIYDGVKAKCLYHLWPRWNYTWVRRRDPDEAFYSNEEYLYKFFVLDDKYVNLEGDADLNWGKFKNQDMPLIVWEPNDQELIKKVQYIFLKSPFDKGYAFAINIDAAMYQVYTGNISKENLNQPLIEFDKMDNIVYTIFDDKLYLFNNLYNKLKIFNLNNNELILEKEIEIELPENILKDVTVFNDQNKKDEKYLLIYNKDLKYCFYKLNIKSLIISKKNCSNLLNDIKNLFNLNITSYSLDLINNKYLIFSYVDLNRKNEINNQIILFIIKEDNLIYINEKNLPSNIINFNNSIKNIAIKCYNEKCLLLYQENNDIYINSYLISYNDNMKQLLVYKYVNYGVGLNFNLDIFQDPINKKLKYFIVKDNAFCYHNENQNKDAFVFVCEQKEYQMSHVLNYIYGDLPLDFNNLKDLDKDYFSVCSTRIISETYDLGDNPKIKTFIDKNNSFSFIELHDGITGATWDLPFYCGLSNFFGGIVADNWYIADVDIQEKEYIEKNDII